jgi:hypothetical protein
MSNPLTNDCGGASSYIRIGSAVAMQLKGFGRQVLGGKATHAYIDVLSLHQLDRQAIQHLLS